MYRHDEPSLRSASRDGQSLYVHMSERLDELCASHDSAAADLYLLGRRDLERACGAMRRFGHLRDLMRLRLFAAGCCQPENSSATRTRLLAEWPHLFRAARQFDQLARRRP